MHSHEESDADMNYHACERNDIHAHTDADLFVHGILLVCISVRFDQYLFFSSNTGTITSTKEHKSLFWYHQNRNLLLKIYNISYR